MTNWKRIANEFFKYPITMGSFYHTLCKAIQRADPDNLTRLRKGFPELVNYITKGPSAF